MYCEHIFDFVMDCNWYYFPRRSKEDLVYNIAIMDDTNKLETVVLHVGSIEIPFTKDESSTWTPKWDNFKTWETGLLFYNMYWTTVRIMFTLEGYTTNVKLSYEVDTFSDKEMDFFGYLQCNQPLIRPFISDDHLNYCTYYNGIVGLTYLEDCPIQKPAWEQVSFLDEVIGYRNLDYIRIPSEAGRELMFDFTLYDVDDVVQGVEFQYGKYGEKTLFRWELCGQNKWKPIHNNFGTALGGLYRSDLLGVEHFKLRLLLSDSERHTMELTYKSLPLNKLPMLFYAVMIPYKNDMAERQYIYFSNSKRNLCLIGNDDTDDDRQDGEDA